MTGDARHHEPEAHHDHPPDPRHDHPAEPHHDHPAEPHHEHGSTVGRQHSHSHDPADLIDDVLATTAAGIRAVKIGLLGLVATALVQVALVGVTGSVALLSDTVHNFGDCLTAFPIWLAFHLARRPASERFTYGLGRLEDLSGLVVVAAIGLSGVFALVESVDRLLNPAPVNRPWIVVLAGLVGMVGNELVARYRIRAGRRIGSLALVADGEHARTDGLTSLAVVGSGLAAVVGWNWADPIVGLVIAGLIAVLFVRTTRPVVARLLDVTDPELTHAVYAAAAATPGVRGVEAVQVRWLGHRARAELAVCVDPALSVAGAAVICESVAQEVRAHVGPVKTATVRGVPDQSTEAPAAG